MANRRKGVAHPADEVTEGSMPHARGADRATNEIRIPVRSWFHTMRRAVVVVLAGVAVFALLAPGLDGVPADWTRGEALALTVFLALWAAAFHRGSRRADLVASGEGIRVRRVRLRWEELDGFEWDPANQALWAVRSEDRRWFRRRRVPIAAGAVYRISGEDVERIRSMHTAHQAPDR